MMNVFDDEMELASQEELERIKLLVEAGLTLSELRAWENCTGGVN